MTAAFGTIGLPTAVPTGFNGVTTIEAYYPNIPTGQVTGLDITDGNGVTTIGANSGLHNTLYSSTWGSIVRIFGSCAVDSNNIPYINRLGIECEFNVSGPFGAAVRPTDQPFEINIPYNVDVTFLSFTALVDKITSIGVGITILPAGSQRAKRVGAYKVGPFGIADSNGVFFDQMFGCRNSVLDRLLIQSDPAGAQIASISTVHSNSVPVEQYFAYPQSADEMPSSPATLSVEPIRIITGNYDLAQIGNLTFQTSSNSYGPFANSAALPAQFSLALLSNFTRVSSIFGWATPTALQAIGFNLFDL